MLEGLENAWYSTQGDNQVTFRNIPHGNYVFKVKTRFRNQEWNENAAQLTVVIAPPPLAYLVCQIGLCHIVYLRIICIAPFL